MGIDISHVALLLDLASLEVFEHCCDARKRLVTVVEFECCGSGQQPVDFVSCP